MPPGRLDCKQQAVRVPWGASAGGTTRVIASLFGGGALPDSVHVMPEVPFAESVSQLAIAGG